MSQLPPIPQQAPMTNRDGTTSPIWAAFFRQILSAFGGSVISYPIDISNGGTGQTTQQSALNSLVGTQGSGKYLRSDGTNTILSAIHAADVPTLNQNTTGTSLNVTGTVAIANGGTGQTTQQLAINALTGTQSAGKYLRSDGTNSTLSSIQSSDVPTLNQNTTGTASNVTGTVAIANGGTGHTAASTALTALLPAQTGNSGKVLKTDGTSASWGSSSVAFTSPTVQKFTSSTGTYTTPSGVLYIRIRMVGGGGGGASSGSASLNNGGAGGDTTFGTSLLVASGGGGGVSATGSGGVGGTGGTASLGTGPIGVALQGGSGSAGTPAAASGTFETSGMGAASPFGGAGGGGANGGSGKAAIANSGSGGGGAGGNGGGVSTGSGGGAGGFVDAIITSPSTSYSYAVGSGGSGGTAGTSGFSGGAGGSGFIIVEELYQ